MDPPRFDPESTPETVLAPSASRRSSRAGFFSRHPHFVSAILALVAGSGLSLLVLVMVQSAERSKLRRIFQFNARHHLASFETDLARHQEIVIAIAELFSSSQNVTREEFRRFVNDTLVRYPYIQGLSWNPLVTAAEREPLEKRAVDDGMNGFRITELDASGQIVPAPHREHYIPVCYIEPLEQNRPALGFNVASNPERRKAIEQARDSGRPVITQRIHLVQEEGEQYGYLLVKAIYDRGSAPETAAERRRHFAGIAVGVFHFRDWISRSMSMLAPLGIDVRITDDSAPEGERFLHFHAADGGNTATARPGPTPEARESDLAWQTTVNVLGRRWSFHFTAAPTFFREHESWIPEASFVAVLCLTGFLTLHLLSRARYEEKLEDANAELSGALQEIKTLKGIIPICSYCHCIRNDEGAWDMLDSYLSKHSDASFSHGICPKCFEKISIEAGLEPKEPKEPGT